MPGNSRGQMLVAAALILGLFVMGLLVAVYQTHALFLQARSVIPREIAGAITADFNRALATMLALATRSYYNHSRFSDFTSRFEEYGLIPRDLESAKAVAYRYLNEWTKVQKIVYAEYGVQVSWQLCASPLPRNPQVYAYDLVFLYWNRTLDYGISYGASYACAQLQLNITNIGFYHWTSNSFIGLTLIIDDVIDQVNTIQVKITVLIDNGTYYGLLLVKGWVEVYLLTNDKWEKAQTKDVTYEGLGRYTIAVSKDSRKNAREVLVVVSDDRGILVLARKEIRGGGGG
ncbi:MAG: hypothetical protein QXK88_10180 [Desulfurococcaceae archaeon]